MNGSGSTKVLNILFQLEVHKFSNELEATSKLYALKL